MKTHRIAASVLFLALLAATGVASAQYYQGQPPPTRHEAWSAPPAQFAAAEQRGYNDGVQGARKDYENHRVPNVYNRDEYRNPHFIAPPDRPDYLRGFRNGYRSAVEQMYGRR